MGTPVRYSRESIDYAKFLHLSTLLISIDLRKKTTRTNNNQNQSKFGTFNKFNY